MATPYTKTFGCGFALFTSLAFFAAAWFVARKGVVTALGLSGVFGFFALSCLALWLVAKAVEWKRRANPAAAGPRTGTPPPPFAYHCYDCKSAHGEFNCLTHGTYLCARCVSAHVMPQCRVVAMQFTPTPHAQPGPVAVSGPGGTRG